MSSLIASEENTKRIGQMVCQTVTEFDNAPDKRPNRPFEVLELDLSGLATYQELAHIHDKS
jgi:hypothetical protein